MEETATKANDTKVNKGLQQISNGMYWNSFSGGAYETTKKEVEPDSRVQVGSVTGKPWAYWGHDNNYPQRLIDAMKSDPAAALIEKKIAFHYGRGLMFFTKKKDGKNIVIEEVLDEDVPNDIHDFMEANDFKNFQEGLIANQEWFHMMPVQYVPSNDGKIVEIKAHNAKDWRPEKVNLKTGKIDNHYLSGFWPLPIMTDNETQFAKIPTFNKKLNTAGIYVHKSWSIDKLYFMDPAWHGITRWLYIASKIPRWILANIDNSMNIKYHVQIPFKYFTDRIPQDMYKNDADYNTALNSLIEDTFKKMDDYLAGEKNVHKAFYSFISLMDDGKPAPGWEITVLDNKIQDEAWLRAYGTAAMAIISGIGLSPSIAGSILPNGLGSGSGSDLREQFNFYIQVMTTRPREITLEPWEIIKRRNNWPKELHLGYRDIVLQSVDQNKSGFATKNEASPTSDSQSGSKTANQILSV